MLIKAFRIALKAHRGQKDKGGKAYIFHPLHVAALSKGRKAKIVALLHDVVEDSEITLDDLRKSGFDAEIVAAVAAITKIKGEAYADYLARVKSNEIARIVKIADLTHNSDLTRLKVITPKDTARARRYRKSRKYLQAI